MKIPSPSMGPRCTALCWMTKRSRGWSTKLRLSGWGPAAQAHVVVFHGPPKLAEQKKDWLRKPKKREVSGLQKYGDDGLGSPIPNKDHLS